MKQTIKNIFNVFTNEEGTIRTAQLDIIELESGNIVDSCQWALDSLTTALDYLTIKKMMLMNLNGEFLPSENSKQVKEEPQPVEEKTPQQQQYQRRAQTVQQVSGQKRQLKGHDPAVAPLVKKILDLVEGGQTVFEFASKNDFYSWLDDTYGNGTFRSAPKLNELDSLILTQIYKTLKGLN
jgi:hypothetical protein